MTSFAADQISAVGIIEARDIRVLDAKVEHAVPELNVDALDALLVVRVVTLVGVRSQHVRRDWPVEVQRVANLRGERDRRALDCARSDDDRDRSGDHPLHRTDRPLDECIHERALPRPATAP